jgi:Gluconate 2-dehydrogenase subunit 3
MVTGALAQPKTAEASDASHGHDSGEGHGAKLSAAQQDEVITAIEQRKASEFTYPSAQAFFNAIRTHTTEGMFAPIYGGNKDFTGWKLVGFRGAQSFFTAADMQSKQASTRGHEPWQPKRLTSSSLTPAPWVPLSRPSSARPDRSLVPRSSRL